MNIRAFASVVATNALLLGTAAHAATYSTAPRHEVAPPLLLLSVSRSLPGCADTDVRCVTTSPRIDALAVAPGEPFNLAVGCDAQPVQGVVVRLPHLYVPVDTLTPSDCRVVELVVHVDGASASLDVDVGGHRYTRPMTLGRWTPLQLIDAEPALFLRLEPGEEEEERRPENTGTAPR